MGKSPIQSLIMAYILQVSQYKLGLPVAGIDFVMDVDHMLDAIGGYGFFQKRNSLLLGLIIFVLTFQTLVMVFIGAEPDWKCAAESVACKQNGTFGSSHNFYKARCSMNRSDWEYTQPFTSIVTEWDLVCDRASYASLAQSILFLGWIPGGLLTGRLADKFGRTRAMFPAVAVVAATAFASSFVDSLWLFLVMRAVIGFFEGGVYATLYVLTTEFVGPKQRGFAGTLVWVFFSLSLMVLAGLAYGIRAWRTLSIVVSAPALPLVFFWWWVPESVRWLLVQSKGDKAKNILFNIAKLNKQKMPQEKLVLNADEAMPTDHEGGVLDLLWPKQQLFKSLILWFTWFTNSVVYYGVTLSVGVLGGSIYLNFFLTGLVEVPANLFAIWFMNKEKRLLCRAFYGRKRALVVCLLLASLFCVLVSAIPPSDTESGNIAGRVILAILGKFSINVAFSTIYVFSSELLPTVIRNVGMGSMLVFDQAGASSAPFVVLLDKQHPMLPFGIMGIFSLVAGCMSYLLPETLGQPTLETLEDARKAQQQAGGLLDSHVTGQRVPQEDIPCSNDKITDKKTPFEETKM